MRSGVQPVVFEPLDNRPFTTFRLSAEENLTTAQALQIEQDGASIPTFSVASFDYPERLWVSLFPPDSSQSLQLLLKLYDLPEFTFDRGKGRVVRSQFTVGEF
ncbi:MAG: hypothetical protein HY735_15130 [Verrucomicrobia bacterium]|nr:hypothetical protein [Verrucomicrobiota bacterium]